MLSVKHNKWSTSIVFIAYFYGLWIKNFFEENFGRVSKSLGGVKIFLKVNNFFISMFIGFLIQYLNYLFFSNSNHIQYVIF